MNRDKKDLPLGRRVGFAAEYSPDALRAISRDDQRRAVEMKNIHPFIGEDVWNCYEFSWMGNEYRPCAAILRVVVPCESKNMVESKSLKLYLNSFAQTTFADEQEVIERLKTDVSEICGVPVGILLMNIDNESGVQELTGDCLDQLAVRIETFQPDTTILIPEDEARSGSVFSHLFRSICPVTGQPDHATIAIAYEGGGVQHESLLTYLVSYREYAGFHEHVVERIYRDLMEVASFTKLSVEGHFLRRGGIDINPFRATHPRTRPFSRATRQ